MGEHTFRVFKKHLQRECADENLNFLVDVIMYRRLVKHLKKERRRLSMQKFSDSRREEKGETTKLEPERGETDRGSLLLPEPGQPPVKQQDSHLRNSLLPETEAPRLKC